MNNLQKLIKEVQFRRKEDAKRFEQLDEDLCMCCHAYGADKRSLWLDCFYDIKEVIPDMIEIGDVEPKPEKHQKGYYVRICKGCRSRFLELLSGWWDVGVGLRGVDNKDHDGRVIKKD